MNEDRRSIREIEADLERHRLALNGNLTALRDRITPGGLAQEAIGLLKRPASEAAAGPVGALAGVLRANPIAALIAGSGLMWAINRATSRNPEKGGAAGDLSVGTAVSAAAALANVVAALEPEDIRAVAAEVDRITRAGAAKVREIDESLRQSAGDFAGSLREGARAARETASDKAKDAKDAVKKAKTRLDDGVESLADGAAASRESANRAGRRARKRAGDAYDEVAGMVERNPLAVGAGAAATGALIAALLGAGTGRGKGKRSG